MKGENYLKHKKESLDFVMLVIDVNKIVKMLIFDQTLNYFFRTKVKFYVYFFLNNFELCLTFF